MRGSSGRSSLWRRAASCTATAQATASTALPKTAMRPSPSVLTSCPRRARTASRRSSKWALRTPSAPASPSRSSTSVDPTRSVNSSATISGEVRVTCATRSRAPGGRISAPRLADGASLACPDPRGACTGARWVAPPVRYLARRRISGGRHGGERLRGGDGRGGSARRGVAAGRRPRAHRRVVRAGGGVRDGRRPPDRHDGQPARCWSSGSSGTTRPAPTPTPCCPASRADQPRRPSGSWRPRAARVCCGARPPPRRSRATTSSRASAAS